jgi:hypothetical protein
MAHALEAVYAMACEKATESTETNIQGFVDIAIGYSAT